MLETQSSQLAGEVDKGVNDAHGVVRARVGTYRKNVRAPESRPAGDWRGADVSPVVVTVSASEGQSASIIDSCPPRVINHHDCTSLGPSVSAISAATSGVEAGIASCLPCLLVSWRKGR